MILFNNQEIPLGNFPNGETYISKPFFAKNKEDIKNVVTLKYESDADLFHLLLVRKAIWFPCDLRITYVPYSRMDRKSDAYVFTLKTFAKFINWMRWDNVTIYEPHSDVTPALLDRCKIIDVTAAPHMRAAINIAVAVLTDPTKDPHYQIYYPDAGAFKRYSEQFKTGDPLTGFKVRDFETGKILALQVVGERHSDTVVMVDDLCSKGGTFVLAAEHLKQMGFKRIVLAVAHCEETIFSGKVFTSGLIDKVITTDSILPDKSAHRGLQIIPLSDFSG